MELWKKLDELNYGLKPSWNWVKAHNGNILNERADFLATNAIKNS
jgi:ribonuclease HI